MNDHSVFSLEQHADASFEIKIDADKMGELTHSLQGCHEQVIISCEEHQIHYN